MLRQRWMPPQQSHQVSFETARPDVVCKCMSRVVPDGPNAKWRAAASVLHKLLEQRDLPGSIT